MPQDRTRNDRRPRLGAAVHLDDLDRVQGLLAYLRDGARDIELRDLTVLGATEGDRIAAFVERARRLLDGQAGRIGLHGPYEGLAVDTPDSDIRAIVQRRYLAGVDAIDRVNAGRGGGHMVVHSPYTTWHWYNRGTNHDDCAGILARTHACLAPVVRRAEDTGTVIVIENCEDKDPAERVALAASFGSPAVRVSLDTGHAHYAHGATGAPPVDVFVRAAGAALAHVHLQDADGFGDRHWRLGQGTVLWPSVFAALAELPEPPRLVIEMARPDDILPSAGWLAAAGLAD